MNTQTERPATWRVVVAAILDFITVFAIGGYIIAKFTGGTTDGGFSLSGAPALALFALIAAYFVVGNKFFRGTLWKHILGTAKAA